MKCEKRQNLPAEQYHAQKDYLSKSTLTRFKKAPILALHEQKQTPAMAFGDMFHQFILEPQRFFENFVFSDSPSRSSKKYKDLKLDNSDKTVLIETETKKLWDMKKSLDESQKFKDYLSKKDGTEISYFGEVFGQPAKCRFDLLTKDGIGVDLKKCQDASPEGVRKSIMNYDYHWQAVFYDLVYESVENKPLKGFVFVFVEEQAPHLVSFHGMKRFDNFGDEAFLFEHTKNQIEVLISQYKDCVNQKNWGGYSPKVQSIELPEWYLEKEKSEASQ